MSVQPVLVGTGLAGWIFLRRTQATQQDVFQRSPELQRDAAYFRERIAGARTAAELVSDTRLLRVALGAFGLEADVPNRAFIRKVLESDPSDSRSFANRLSDKRYLEFARAFSEAGPAQSARRDPAFAERMISAWQTRRFEAAVGARDETMRLALNALRELPMLASRRSRDDTIWFTIMGNPPLRRVFEGALGLPTAFGRLDIDQQLQVLRDRSSALFGDSSAAQFSAPQRVEDLVRRFVIREGAASLPQSGGTTGIALQILASGRPLRF